MVRLAVAIFLVGAMAFAKHEGSEGAGVRPAFSPSCKPYLIGQQWFVKNDGIGALSNDGSRAFGMTSVGKAFLTSPTSDEKKDIDESGMIRLAGFSPDGNFVYVATESGALQLREASSGKKAHELDLGGRPHFAKFSPDGKYLAAVTREGKYAVMEIPSGREVTRGDVSRPTSGLSFSPNGKTLLIGGLDEKAHFVDLTAPDNSKDVKAGGGVLTSAFSADGSLVIAGTRNNSAVVINAATGAVNYKIGHDEWVKAAAFSGDGRYAITGATNGAVYVTDVKSGNRVAKVAHKGEIAEISTSPDGRYFATASADGTTTIFDLQTMTQVKTIQHKDKVSSVVFSPDSKTIATASRDGYARLIDAATGKEIEAIRHGRFVQSVAFSKDGRRLLSSSFGKLAITETDAACPEADMKYLPAKSAATLGANLRQKIEEQLCKKDFSDEDWDELTPQLAGSKLPHATAIAYLLRFQKKGGFETNKHLRLLLSILESDLVEKEPTLVAGALQNVAATSRALYDKLFAAFPKLASLAKDLPNLSACRTEEEAKHFDEIANRHFEYLKKRNAGGGTQYSDWAGLAPMRETYKKLKKAKQEQHAGEVAESMAAAAVEDPEFQGIFHSKLYYFSYEAGKSFFGLDLADHKTDMTTVRDLDKIRVYLLGVHPLNDDPSTRTKYGFHSKRIGEVKLDQDMPVGDVDLKKRGMDPIVNWTHAGRKYKGQLDVKMLSAMKDVAPTGNSFPYEQLLKDGKLTGVIMTGWNARDDGAAWSMDQYVDYLQDQGFDFSKKQDIANVHAFLKDQISNGKADYFIKEAHSDGDEKNLFRLDNVASKMVATKKRKDGRVEEIHLLFPKEEKVETHLLSNQEFGEWIRNRAAGGKDPLVYFSESCWSWTKARHEMEAAYSKHFIVVPSTTMIAGVSNTPGSSARILLDTFRNGKSYKDIREELKDKNDRYRNGVGDIYIFPDEEEYKRRLTDLLKLPLKHEIKIWDQEGKRYSLEQVGH